MHTEKFNFVTVIRYLFQCKSMKKIRFYFSIAQNEEERKKFDDIVSSEKEYAKLKTDIDTALVVNS